MRGFHHAVIAVGAILLFWNLGKPALWNDEAETALRAETILATGVPRAELRGTLVTTQWSLADHEKRERDVWIWNTWLPAYLVAASFKVFGHTPWAARLPFALAGLLTLWLSWRMYSEAQRDAANPHRAWARESALALLALSPVFLLFCRQSRYYALIALGSVMVLRAWRRLLAGRRWGVLGVALSLQFLLHSFFVFFAIALLTLALDAALRGRECLRGRFAAAALLTLALAAPAAWYFRVWDRPGNHLYGFAESLEFLKTFLLWLAAFVVPTALVGAAMWRRWSLAAAGFALLCGLVAEGPGSLVCAVLAWGAALGAAVREPAPRGVMNLSRVSLLLVGTTLAVLSFTAAEPYGRYLVGLAPVCAYLVARSLSLLSDGRPKEVAALTALTLAGNPAFILPLKAAQTLTAPAAPRESVSGMMRQRLRDLKPRSDLALYAREVFRGPVGYVEAAAAAMRGGGSTFFADANELALLFATSLRPVYPDAVLRAEPDWLMPSPWLKLTPDAEARVQALASSGRYAAVAVEAPLLLWQNNPDPLFRDYAPPRGPLTLLRRKTLSARR